MAIINYKVLDIIEKKNNDLIILAEIKGSDRHYAPYGVYLRIKDAYNIFVGDVISHNKYVDIVDYPEEHKKSISQIHKCISYLFKKNRDF